MKLSRERFHQGVSYVMAFVLGTIVGAAIFLFYFGHLLDEKMIQINELTAENENLTKQVKELRNTKNELEEKRNQTQELQVEDIEINISNKEQDSLDKVIKLELLTKVRKDVEFLKNKPLNIVSELHDSVRSIFESKKYEIKEQTVIVEFEAIAIYKTVRIWLQAEIEK